jgi:type I restriction enzyme S subunit
VNKLKKVKLVEVTEYISRGITPSYTLNENISVINQKCIRNNKINFDFIRFTNPKKKKIAKEKYLFPYDVLINSTGVGTLGRVAQIKNVDFPITCDSHVTIVRPNNKIDPVFLGYNLFFQQSNIENLAHGSTGQTELSRKRLGEAILIPLLPIKAQKKIAKILSDLDDKIEINEKINKKLEEIAQAIFKHWFIDFEYPVILDYECEIDEELKSELIKYGYKSFGGLPAPEKGKIFVYVLKKRDDSLITGTTDFLLKEYNKLKKENPEIEKFIYWEKFNSENEAKEKEEYLRTEEGKKWLKEGLKNNPKFQKGKMKESKLGKIPENWKIDKIENLLICVGGGTPSTKSKKYWKEGKINWVTPKDLSNLEFPILTQTERKITEEGLKKISSRLLPIGTVLLSSRAPIGYTAITKISTSINQGFIAIKSNERINKYYIYNWVNYYIEEIKKRANGTSFLEISKRNFKQMDFLIPKELLLKKYEEISNFIFKSIYEKINEIKNLSKLRDTLLPKLMSGELSVENLDIDTSEGGEEK